MPKIKRCKAVSTNAIKSDLRTRLRQKYCRLVEEKGNGREPKDTRLLQLLTPLGKSLDDFDSDVAAVLDRRHAAESFREIDKLQKAKDALSIEIKKVIEQREALVADFHPKLETLERQREDLKARFLGLSSEQSVLRQIAKAGPGND